MADCPAHATEKDYNRSQKPVLIPNLVSFQTLLPYNMKKTET